MSEESKRNERRALVRGALRRVGYGVVGAVVVLSVVGIRFLNSKPDLAAWHEVILDEEFTITLRVEDNGAVPADIGEEADIVLAIDGGQPRAYRIPVTVTFAAPVQRRPGETATVVSDRLHRTMGAMVEAAGSDPAIAARTRSSSRCPFASSSS